MPIRILSILASLVATTVGLFALACVTGSELYFFMPSRYLRIQPPPSHPGAVFAALAVPFAVTIVSRHYGLIVFMLFPLGLFLGSAIGFAFLGWTPSLCQHLLFVSAVATASYAWSQREYLDY